MPDRTRDHIEAIAAELERIGAADVTFVRGRKHMKVTYLHRGVRRTYSFASTPSDHRGLLNALTELRHQAGVPGPVRPRSARAPKRRAAPRPAPWPAEWPVRPDPWRALLRWRGWGEAAP